jgi:hypothetical protein
MSLPDHGTGTVQRDLLPLILGPLLDICFSNYCLIQRVATPRIVYSGELESMNYVQKV